MGDCATPSVNRAARSETKSAAPVSIDGSAAVANVRNQRKRAHKDQRAGARPSAGRSRRRGAEHRVTDEKDRQQPTDLDLAEAEFRHHAFRGDRNARALDVGKERKAQQAGKKQPANASTTPEDRIGFIRETSTNGGDPRPSWKQVVPQPSVRRR